MTKVVGWRPMWEVWQYGDGYYKAIYHKKPVPILDRRYPYEGGLTEEQYLYLCFCRKHGMTTHYDCISGQFGDTGDFINKDEIQMLIEAYEEKKHREECNDNDLLKKFGRYRENLARAKSRVEEIALCNDFDYFVTITVNPDNCNRQSLDDIYDLVIRKYFTHRRIWYREFCKKKNLDLSKSELKYVLVPELHKDGKSFHLHGLIKMGCLWEDNLIDYKNTDIQKLPKRLQKIIGDSPGIFYDKNLEKKVGFNTWEVIRDREKAARYITKYVSKGMGLVSDVIDSGKHLYFSSPGMAKKIPVEVRADFDRMQQEIAYEYESEYCTVIWYHKSD